MCVYKFIEQNHNYIECIEGNFKNEGVISIYKDGKFTHYIVKDEMIVGFK